MDKKLNLLVERVLKRETNELLKEVERLMAEDGVEKALASNKGNNEENPGRNQFKTLMDAAGQASCIEELLLFLSYQKSKSGGWKNECRNGKSIAENVADSFMKVQNKIYQAVVEEKEKEPEIEEINDEDERTIRLKITEKYMGYLYWKAYVVSK